MFIMRSTFKIVTYVRGLMVFLIRDPRCGLSHSDSNSLEPFLKALCGSWLPRKRGEERTELSFCCAVLSHSVLSKSL